MPLLKFRKSPKWYVDFTYNGRHKWAVSADKLIAQAFELHLLQLIEYRRQRLHPTTEMLAWAADQTRQAQISMAKLGLVDPPVDVETRLGQTLDDYIRFLDANDRAPRHISQVRQRIQDIFDGTGAQALADLTAESVAACLKALRAGPNGITAATSNHYLNSAKSFIGWCMERGRAYVNPLANLRRLNEAIGKKPRRPLTAAELSQLLATVKDKNRYWLYRLAAETGLRKGELGGLERDDFKFGSKPTVTVRASVSKSGETAILPLLSETAGSLKEHLAKPWCIKGLRGAQSGALYIPDRLAEKFRDDLDAAKVDSSDRDFHTLRHTFITNLARAGVYPSVAQALARHSTITLTMDYYTHTDDEDLRAAVAKLPQSGPKQRKVRTPKDTGQPRSGKQRRRGAT